MASGSSVGDRTYPEAMSYLARSIWPCSIKTVTASPDITNSNCYSLHFLSRAMSATFSSNPSFIYYKSYAGEFFFILIALDTPDFKPSSIGAYYNIDPRRASGINTYEFSSPSG